MICFWINWKRPVSGIGKSQTAGSEFLIAGFVNIASYDAPFELQLENSTEELNLPECVKGLVCILSEKPNYETGSSKPISVSNEKANVAAIWKLENSADELIEDDDLLDEKDLKKPDPSSLSVCGTAGTSKRKACKDCSCGLAEELENEKTEKQKDTANAKSSCGNCYLGDAFRCESCPYLGMPAFKPGEKIQLSD